MQEETLQTDQAGGTQGVPSGAPGDEIFGIARDDLSIGLIALGSVMMLIVIARMLGRRSRVQTAGSRSERTGREVARPGLTSTAGHDRLERLMTDAEELTRRLAAVLDNKAARIEVLIEQADERLAALERAQERAEPEAQPAPARPGLSLTEESAPAAPAVDPLHRKVYDMADRGMTPVDIARQIDRPTGQVELILALRRA